jgi:polyisoprenoid-binding protein YceI
MSGSKPRPRGEAPRMTERRPGPVGLIGSMGRVARCSLLALVPVFVIPPARAESLYTIDQRFGSIEFTVGHLGLFTSHGRFTKFDATLTIDPVHPERTRIVVEVNAVSVDMPWQDGVAMLRSAAYFDVQHYPEVDFRSTGVTPASPDHYVINGLLQIRGITQPIALDASLVGRRQGADGAPIADFVAKGQLRRSAFGMTADESFISDKVDLTITVRIRLSEPTHAG